MKIPNRLYDILKWVAIILLPALAVLYSTLGLAWGWPMVTEIVITINGIALFIGALIGVSSIAHNKELKQE
jgi:hypothetical protein